MKTLFHQPRLGSRRCFAVRPCLLCHPTHQHLLLCKVFVLSFDRLNMPCILFNHPHNMTKGNGNIRAVFAKTRFSLGQTRTYLTYYQVKNLPYLLPGRNVVSFHHCCQSGLAAVFLGLLGLPLYWGNPDCR